MSALKYIDVFPFAFTGEELQFLLLQRAANNTYPGIWQPVSGKIKPGEKAWQAAIREFAEETSIPPLSFYALDHVSSYYLHPSDQLIQVPAFMVEVAKQDPTLNHEHSAFKWLSLNEALALASWEPYRKALDSIPRLLHTSPALALAKISLKNQKHHINP